MINYLTITIILIASLTTPTHSTSLTKPKKPSHKCIVSNQNGPLYTESGNLLPFKPSFSPGHEDSCCLSLDFFDLLKNNKFKSIDTDKICKRYQQDGDCWDTVKGQMKNIMAAVYKNDRDGARIFVENVKVILEVLEVRCTTKTTKTETMKTENDKTENDKTENNNDKTNLNQKLEQLEKTRNRLKRDIYKNQPFERKSSTAGSWRSDFESWPLLDLDEHSGRVTPKSIPVIMTRPDSPKLSDDEVIQVKSRGLAVSPLRDRGIEGQEQENPARKIKSPHMPRELKRIINKQALFNRLNHVTFEPKRGQKDQKQEEEDQTKTLKNILSDNDFCQRRSTSLEDNYSTYCDNTGKYHENIRPGSYCREFNKKYQSGLCNLFENCVNIQGECRSRVAENETGETMSEETRTPNNPDPNQLQFIYSDLQTSLLNKLRIEADYVSNMHELIKSRIRPFRNYIFLPDPNEEARNTILENYRNRNSGNGLLTRIKEFFNWRN